MMCTVEKERKTSTPQPVRVINLWRNPETVFEALGLVSEILHTEDAATHEDMPKGLSLLLGAEKIGELIFWPWEGPLGLRTLSTWIPPAAFAQHDLIRALFYLLTPEPALYLPGQAPIPLPFPLTPLGNLAHLGPDARDIHDGFTKVDTPTPYPAFWSHKAQEVTTLRQRPNAYLEPLSQAKASRPLRKVEDLWPKRGRLMLAERLRLNTQAAPTVWLPREALSNVWWPCRLDATISPERREQSEKALTLWMNSTLGLLLLLGHREETEGAWVKFKKPIWQSLPVPDVQRLGTKVLSDLSRVFEDLAQEPLLPLSRLNEDTTRAFIDKAIAEAFDLPDPSPLRELLAREPILTLRPLYLHPERQNPVSQPRLLSPD